MPYKNKEDKKNYYKQYYINNKDKILEYNNNRNRNKLINKDKQKGYNREYYEKNKTNILKSRKQFYKNNRSEINEYYKLYYHRCKKNVKTTPLIITVKRDNVSILL